ncbi:membrane-bound lytic murein transglycosylase MltF [Pseudohaliea rubra]|uniref:Membrane-bound lytic murein transglycosylase F n=1 Tax=Pseudohaliea rubra DSM 19751 TaxID=1265313 RepID=A0A095VUF9_9GAMM|nr:membrane-bound lytic murein transglycosylase MltF [Pseudohaliea rubra]KGE05000.1 Transglycosylase, Slt family [Pseudohaliea rubra DSM 19751]
MLKLLALIAVVVLGAFTGGCGSPADNLETIRERGELRFVTRNGPTTYYRERGEPAGFEYDLARRFAQELGVSLRIIPVFSLEGLFAALRRGEADIAGAGLTLTAERAAAFPVSAAYHEQRPQLIYRTGTPRPRRLEDLEGREVLVLAGSSHGELLAARQGADLPGLTVRAVAGADPLDLLRQVDRGSADAAIVDSVEFAIQRHLLPQLAVAFDLAAERDMVWYLTPGGDSDALRERLAEFFQRLERGGTLAALREAHLGQVDVLTRAGSQTFIANIRSKLPAYRTAIEQVAREHQLDWALLAAIAYQESHWDPEAVSPTGVRGMMMLTRATARDLGVPDRRDPLQSLRGGARYFKELRRRLPGDIAEPDRTWLALAAYNIGLGHLEDARVLTERAGGDPHHWQDVMTHLPKLEQRAYYTTVRHGYARGREAVRYVQNIRHYHSVLQWRFIAENRPAPPLDVEPLLPEQLRGRALRAL